MPAPKGRNPFTIFTDFADQSEDSEALVIPEDLSELGSEDLAELTQSAIDAFNAVRGDGSELSADDLVTLGDLADGIEALNAEAESRNALAAERSAAAEELAARIAPAELSDDSEEVVEGDEEDGEENGETAEVEVVEESEEEALVASGGRRTIRVNTTALRSRSGAQTPSTSSAPATIRDVVHAAPDTGLFATGQGLNFSDMGRAVAHRLTSFASGRMGSSRQQFGIASITKPFEEGLVIRSSDAGHVQEVLDRAVDETRLPGNSLVASGGWCAPSETLYDLYDMGESREGLISLPEVGVTRGGISFPGGIDFSTLFTDVGFSFTEAEDEEGDYDGEGGGSKPCFKVPCVEFDEERLAVDGLCITAGLLQTRAYPEVIADVIRRSLVAHDHRLAGSKIAGIVAGSTAITMPTTQAGATAPLLTAIELQIEHYRTIHRLGRGQSLEAIFPYWVRGAVRSDLSRRLGVDMISVPDARIDGWFREAGANPQFVYNWQDIGTTAASGFTQWPTTVDFLLYKAGTWVVGGSDIITLDTLYDSELMGTNDYTALFTEEGWLLAKRGVDSRVVTVGLTADGATHGGIDIAHDGTAA